MLASGVNFLLSVILICTVNNRATLWEVVTQELSCVRSIIKEMIGSAIKVVAVYVNEFDRIQCNIFACKRKVLTNY